MPPLSLQSTSTVQDITPLFRLRFILTRESRLGTFMIPVLVSSYSLRPPQNSLFFFQFFSGYPHVWFLFSSPFFPPIFLIRLFYSLVISFYVSLNQINIFKLVCLGQGCKVGKEHLLIAAERDREFKVMIYLRVDSAHEGVTCELWMEWDSTMKKPIKQRTKRDAYNLQSALASLQ